MNEKEVTLKTYTVRLQVIKIYDVEVKADSQEEAVETAMQSQSTEIEKSGKLVCVTTDYPSLPETEVEESA